MPLMFPFCLVLGLFLPGAFIARRLKHGLWAATAFVVSLLILFHSIFWLGVFGAPITLWSVFLCLAIVSLAGFFFERRSAARVEAKRRKWKTLDWILIASTALVGISLLARSAISPMIGFDTLFRWDFLAQRILSLRRFDFYPPLTPAHFQNYFSVDSIPPLVSFTHWWLYASIGHRFPALISLFVAAQFVCTLVFVFGAASALFSRRAGFLAAAMLAACPLYFRAVVLGQETGLTALAIAATIYLIGSAKLNDDSASTILAGLAAGLCALSREYGWIAVPAGIIALLWRRHQPKQIGFFVASAALAAGPWYVRNLVLTGNPFYPLSFANLSVNPVYNAILQSYNALLGVQHWGANEWTSVLQILLWTAPLQIVLGIAGGILNFRKHGYLIAIALLLTAVWIQAAGYTSGGVENSIRVLSPAMVTLSILGAGALQRWVERASLMNLAVAVVILCQVWTAGHGVFYPSDPLSIPMSQWRESAFQAIPAPIEFQLREALSNSLRAGSRIVSDNAYLHAALIDKGIEVVPVWSPEVSFLFSATAQEASDRLEALGIAGVGYYPQSLNTTYLISASPFYASLPQRWRARAEAAGVFTLYTPNH